MAAGPTRGTSNGPSVTRTLRQSIASVVSCLEILRGDRKNDEQDYSHSFSVASSRKYTTAAGESREEVEWFNCSVFRKLAENCNQYLGKGKQVYVDGRLSSRTYQTQNGETRHSNDINVTEIQFLGQRGERGDQEPTSEEDEVRVDLPF